MDIRGHRFGLYWYRILRTGTDKFSGSMGALIVAVAGLQVASFNGEKREGPILKLKRARHEQECPLFAFIRR